MHIRTYSNLMLYSVGRVVIEGFRTDSLMLGPLRAAQVMSLLLFTGAMLVLIYQRKTGKIRTYSKKICCQITLYATFCIKR